MKKIFILIVVLILLLPNIAFAGIMKMFSCDSCGFKSSNLPEGVGLRGIENTIVYCESCKNFYTIPTQIAFSTDYNKNVTIVKSIAKEKFLGEECLIYPCPVCNGKAFTYKGTTCPICKKETLKSSDVALWD